MKRSVPKIYLSAAVTIFIFSVIPISGCEEQNFSETKRHRLVAAENLQLKAEIEQCNKKIEEQKALNDSAMERQKELLERCRREIESWKERSTQGVKEQMGEAISFVVDRSAELQAENKKLKAQIEELKKGLAAIKGTQKPKEPGCTQTP